MKTAAVVMFVQKIKKERKKEKYCTLKRRQCSVITLNWLKINNATIATVHECNEVTGRTD